MEDKQIVDLFLGRDETAVTEAQKKYGAYIISIAINILESRHDAEECENDTYLSAWNSIPPQIPLNLKTFLGRIAKNSAIDMFRKSKASKRDSSMTVIFSELGECASELLPSSDDVESVTDMGELTKAINSYLHSLSREKRIMFVKRYWYGESLDDISVEMGITTAKIATTLFRVRKDLKESLQKEGIVL